MCADKMNLSKFNEKNVAQRGKETCHFDACNCESRHEIKVNKVRRTGSQETKWNLHDTKQQDKMKTEEKSERGAKAKWVLIKHAQ